MFQESNSNIAIKDLQIQEYFRPTLEISWLI